MYFDFKKINTIENSACHYTGTPVLIWNGIKALVIKVHIFITYASIYKTLLVYMVCSKCFRTIISKNIQIIVSCH